MRFDLSENGIYLTFEKNEEDGTLRFLHFGAEPLCEEAFGGRSTAEGFRLVEVNAAGYDRPLERQGNKYIVTAPGYRLQYAGHSDSRNENGRKLEFTLTDEETGLTVVSHMQFFDGISVVRCWNTVTNTGNEPQTIDTISSFHYTGLEKEGVLPWEEKMELRIPFNAWQQELNWKTFSLPELGLVSSTYDRAKIEAGIIHSCHKRPISTQQINSMIDEIETEIFNREEKEIETSAIGELVMKKLQLLDEVAYVRFASVYREFKDVNTFMEEISKLLKK